MLLFSHRRRTTDGMEEKFINVSSYNHALDSHRDYTETLQGTGLFNREDRVDNELSLRESVVQFLGSHTELEGRRLTAMSEELVPIYESFAKECVEGYLPARLASKLAAKSMLHYGLQGDFQQLDGIFKAYRSTLEVMSIQRQIVARTQVARTLAQDTPYHSDRLSVLPETDRSVTDYSRTLRRLLARGVLAEEVYVQRVEEANLRPIPLFMRKLRLF